MKNRIGWIGVMCCLLALGLTGCKQETGTNGSAEGNASGNNAKPIELSYSIFFPATHIQCITADAWARGNRKTDQWTG